MAGTEPLDGLWDRLGDLEHDLAHIRASAEIQRRFDEAAKTCPIGHALVAAAIDLRRAGYFHPIPAEHLIEVARMSIARLQPGEPASEEELREGIEWASAGDGEQLPLLIRSDDGYRASPALGCDLDPPPIPKELWEWLFATLPPEYLVRVAGAASLAGNVIVAERAWLRATEAEEELIRRLAWAGLGELWIDEEDYDGAIYALERADGETLLPFVGATPIFNLGLLYDRRGDTERARAYYERAIEADDLRASPPAAFNLGLLLGELDDADGAEAAFKRAMQGPVLYERAAEAPYALGNILRRLGRPERARIYYQQAIDTGDDTFAAKAALALAQLCEERDEYDDALTAYEHALVSSDPETLAKAIWNYGRLAAFAHEADVQDSYQRLLQRLPDDVVPPVTCQLGEWAFWYHKTPTAAIALFEQAMASGHRDAAPRAALFRGWVAQGYRGHRKARAAYQRAIDSGHQEYAPRAANNLGALLAERGETDDALAAFTLARIYTNAKIGSRAAFNTGLLFVELEQHDDARRALEEAIETGDRFVAPSAVAHLARLLTRQGKQGASEELLGRWRTAGDDEMADAVDREVARLEAPTAPHQRRDKGFFLCLW